MYKIDGAKNNIYIYKIGNLKGTKMRVTNDILNHPELELMRQRFNRRVTHPANTKCWLWSGALDPAGYGQWEFKGYQTKAHRVAWLLAKGAIPDSGTKRSLSVCHTCDNRLCMNPSHMFLGTDADNVADMVAKGRQSRGENHYTAKRRKLGI